MFDGPDFPNSLDESIFESWLETGRESKMSYAYLLVVWDALERHYFPVYVEDRSAFDKYQMYPDSVTNESLIAIYDLYSESKIQRAI